jgi:hypothetical protein
VINSEMFWPASIANVPPHTTYAFTVPMAEIRQPLHAG